MARHFGLDWLRIGAFGLLILYHIGMFFVHAGWGWHVKTAHPLDWVAIPMLATNPWRLSLLFVVSGYASTVMLARLASPGAFLRDRTMRLMLPLFAAVVLVIPPQPWVELVTQHGYAQSLGYFWIHDYFRFGTLDGIVLPTWQHLWFVVYLWVYTIVFAVLVMLVPTSARARLKTASDQALGDWRVFVVPVALLIAHLLWTWPWQKERHDLIGDLPYHRVYFAAFLFGVLLVDAPRVWRGIRRWWGVAGLAAIAAYGFIVWVELSWPGQTIMPAWAVMPFAIAKTIQSWSAIVALLGVADRWWNRDHPWRATLAEAVFPFYIVHQTIIVITGWWLLQFALPSASEFAIILPTTIMGCWGFYLVGRRLTPLRPLIGLKPVRSPTSPPTTRLESPA